MKLFCDKSVYNIKETNLVKKLLRKSAKIELPIYYKINYNRLWVMGNEKIFDIYLSSCFFIDFMCK